MQKIIWGYVSRMNQPTKKQIQWFWEQCGWYFKQLRFPIGRWYYGSGIEGAWVSPDCEHLYTYPRIDLNSLFKYAVPFLVRWEMGSKQDGSVYAIACMKGQQFPSNTDDKDPALSLFWAIYKAVGGEE